MSIGAHARSRQPATASQVIVPQSGSGTGTKAKEKADGRVQNPERARPIRNGSERHWGGDAVSFDRDNDSELERGYGERHETASRTASAGRPAVAACVELPCQRATGTSAPVNRTGPDGSPVLEPPLGSRLTASVALASATAVSCGRTRGGVGPGCPLGDTPSERPAPPRGTPPTPSPLAAER